MTRPILFVVDYDPQRAALVPRAMTVLGLIGGPLLFASGIAVLFGRESGILTARALTKLIILVYSLIILAKRCGSLRGKEQADEANRRCPGSRNAGYGLIGIVSPGGYGIS